MQKTYVKKKKIRFSRSILLPNLAPTTLLLSLPLLQELLHIYIRGPYLRGTFMGATLRTNSKYIQEKNNELS